MSVFKQILKQLNQSGLEYKLSEHQAVRTSEEAAKIRGVELKTGAKAMVLKSKGSYFLFVLPADKRIDWKKVKSLLESKEVRFATEQEAEEVTGVKMGSVPPFGNILNLPTFFDQALLEIEYLNFNPGSNVHSVQMKGKDLVAMVKPAIVDVS